MKDFIAFLDVRRCKNWARKISSWKYLRPVLPDFPEHRVPHFWSPFWAPFRGCWRSATAAAHNLILVEVDGKCSWQVPISSWQCPWPNYLNSQGFSILLGEKDHVTFLEGIAMRIWDQEYTLDPRHYAMGKREPREQGSPYLRPLLCGDPRVGREPPSPWLARRQKLQRKT